MHTSEPKLIQTVEDRCIPIILEKSNKKSIINLIEIWKAETMFSYTLHTLTTLFLPENLAKCSLCSVVASGNVYIEYNNYLLHTTTVTNNYTKLHSFFDKIKETNLNGRDLEIAFPILLIAYMLGEDILEVVVNSLKKIMGEKKEEQFLESKDITFLDFVSQLVQDDKFIPITNITQDFKKYLQQDEYEERWITTKWVGRALHRLKITKAKRRLARGIEVIPDILKAQEKMRVFR